MQAPADQCTAMICRFHGFLRHSNPRLPALSCSSHIGHSCGFITTPLVYTLMIPSDSRTNGNAVKVVTITHARICSYFPFRHSRLGLPALSCSSQIDQPCGLMMTPLLHKRRTASHQKMLAGAMECSKVPLGLVPLMTRARTLRYPPPKRRFGSGCGRQCSYLCVRAMRSKPQKQWPDRHVSRTQTIVICTFDFSAHVRTSIPPAT
jgi:hypothetical protein